MMVDTRSKRSRARQAYSWRQKMATGVVPGGSESERSGGPESPQSYFQLLVGISEHWRPASRACPPEAGAFTGRLLENRPADAKMTTLCALAANPRKLLPEPVPPPGDEARFP